MDWVEPGLLPDDGIMFVYSAEAFDTAQIHLPPEELKSWEWCDLATVESRVPGFMFRRLELAVLALKNGDFFELENGIRT